MFFEAAGFARADAAADFDLFEVEVAPVLVLCGKLSVWEGFCGLEAEAVFARFKGGIGEMGGGVGVGRVQGVGFFEMAQGFFEVSVFAGLAVEEVVGIAGKVVCAAAVGQGEGAAQEFALCFAGGEFGNFEYQGRIAGVEEAAGAVEVVEGIFFPCRRRLRIGLFRQVWVGCAGAVFWLRGNCVFRRPVMRCGREAV